MRELKDIQQQRQLKILVLGETCVDIYRFGKCTRLSAEAPVPILLQQRSEEKPGMAANVNLNIESLGHSTFHVTNKNIIKKERMIAEGVSGSPQQVLRIDSNDNCDPINIDNLAKFLNENTFDATVISDYDKGFLPEELLGNIVQLLPKPIFVDSKKTNLSYFEDCIIKINEVEREAAHQFPSNCELITTLGERGAKWNENIYPATKARGVFDVCGAGDSFLAGLCIGYLGTHNLDPAIKFANICAGISVKYLGVYNVSFDDILENY